MATHTQRARRLPRDVRRRELLDATLDVIYEQGPAAVSVEAVARRAGVTRPVVYDYFGDLGGLLDALIDREEGEALAPLLAFIDGAPLNDPEPERVLVAGIKVFLEAVRANPRTWRLVLMTTFGSSPVLRERFAAGRRDVADRVAELLEWGLAKRGGPPGLDLQLAARLVVAAGEDAARLTLLHPRRYPPERIASLTGEALALLPVSPRPAPAPPAPGSATSAAVAAVAADAVPQVPPPGVAPPARMARAERREQLLDATLDLLAEDGFAGLNMEAIARRAGVNRAVVYRSFSNLKLLLLALLQREDRRTRETIEDLLPGDPSRRTVPELLHHALATFLEAVLASPQTYRLVLQRPESAPRFLQKMVNRRRAMVAERLRPLVEWWLQAVSLTLDVDLLARMLLSVAEEMARLTLDDPEFPPERLLGGAWTLLAMLPSEPPAPRRRRTR